MPDTTSIVTKAQTIEIDGVTDIIVTATTLDEDAGDYVRELRFFGIPAAEGQSAPLVFTLRIRHPQRDAIAITVPQQDF